MTKEKEVQGRSEVSLRLGWVHSREVDRICGSRGPGSGMCGRDALAVLYGPLAAKRWTCRDAGKFGIVFPKDAESHRHLAIP